MCGLIGYAGKDLSKFDATKFNVLGFVNEQRGKHSCGVAVDGEIFVGVKDEKLFSDFIMKTGYPAPKELPILIGHTRAATNGSHSIENAHPFGFGELDGKFEFMGAHNGTLLNHKDLAKEYFIDEKKYDDKEEFDKIDSEILLELLYRYDKSEILKKYLGAAALIFTDTNNPNVMYVFRGESKNYPAASISISERPLFYYQESKNSVYLSSLEEPLKFIRARGEGKIEEFTTNTLYKITDGDVANAEKTVIDRTGKHQKGAITTYGRHNHHNAWDDDYGYGGYGQAGYNRGRNGHFKSKKKKEKAKAKLITAGTTFRNALANETAKESDIRSGNIYYKQLRYWKYNTLVSGIFTILTDNTIQFLGVLKSTASQAYKEIPSEKKFTDSEKTFLYFYKGILLNLEQDYIICRSAQVEFNTVQLSHVSRYPIINLEINDPLAFLNGKTADAKYLPIASDFVYKIISGKLNSYVYSPPNDDKKEPYIIEADLELYNIMNKKGEDKQSQEDIDSCITRYEDEILASIEVCNLDVEEDIEDSSVTVKIIDTLIKIKEFTKEKFKSCLIEKPAVQEN